jgi:hypothetical protein
MNDERGRMQKGKVKKLYIFCIYNLRIGEKKIVAIFIREWVHVLK